MRKRVIDEYDIDIRRIRKEHANRKFETGDNVFDRINPSGTLREYYESEATGRFKVYVLIEARDKDKAAGVIRIRFELKVLESKYRASKGRRRSISAG